MSGKPRRLSRAVLRCRRPAPSHLRKRCLPEQRTKGNAQRVRERDEGEGGRVRCATFDALKKPEVEFGSFCEAFLGEAESGPSPADVGGDVGEDLAAPRARHRRSVPRTDDWYNGRKAGIGVIRKLRHEAAGAGERLRNEGA